MQHVERMSNLDINEVQFVRDIARSGLSDSQITALLNDLLKPYRYDSHLVAWNFAHGWVQAKIEPEATSDEESFEDVTAEWLEERVENGDVAELGQLLAAVQNAIEQAKLESRSTSPHVETSLQTTKQPSELLRDELNRQKALNEKWEAYKAAILRRPVVGLRPPDAETLEGRIARVSETDNLSGTTVPSTREVSRQRSASQGKAKSGSKKLPGDLAASDTEFLSENPGLAERMSNSLSKETLTFLGKTRDCLDRSQVCPRRNC
ncbi:MAG: hypothetical protein IPK83_04250 [Planctomycetes bacterium]|nr:hypothetical protein [Planctomycetota bacterium]